jgi:membrane-bound lytic murein transglycosylase D
MKLQSILLFGLFIGAIASLIVFSSYSDPRPENEASDAPTAEKSDVSPLEIPVPKIPDSLTFAGEEVPMQEMDIRERFDRELLSISFRHSMTIHSIKLTKRYFPLMDAILKKHGLPLDFKYLAVTESNLRNATSPAGAKGIWQFMPATAKSYGLRVDKEIDERLNFYKTTEAACKLLKRLKNKFGSWTLAAAAYNCGEGRVSERMNAQKGETYYDIVLPEETMRYLPRIFASKVILEDPAAFGFIFEEDDYYPAFPEYKKVEVKTSIASWPDFCKQHNISYRTLTLHNPWIRGYRLTNNSGQLYEVLIPK